MNSLSDIVPLLSLSKVCFDNKGCVCVREREGGEIRSSTQGGWGAAMTCSYGECILTNLVSDSTMGYLRGERIGCRDGGNGNSWVQSLGGGGGSTSCRLKRTWFIYEETQFSMHPTTKT